VSRASAKSNAMVASGARGSQADIFAARSSVVSFEDRASEIGRRIRTAKTVLARWIG
jgi:hypothetical protein